jgi:hypothetical protein
MLQKIPMPEWRNDWPPGWNDTRTEKAVHQ